MIIGIDPGKNGAIAYGQNMNEMAVKKMAIYYDNRAGMYHFFNVYKDRVLKVYIEEQHIRPTDIKNGSVYRIVDGLIRNYHDVLFCLESLKIPHERITAKEWQKKYRLKKGSKQAFNGIAKRKYPGLKPTLATCDAILILEHALIQESYG